MNKTDQYKDAMRVNDFGVDPDVIMMQTVEEYSVSMEDEADTFDEDKKVIDNITFEMEDCGYELEQIERQIADLTAKIDECEATIERMQTELNKSKNWAMNMEYENFIREEERDIVNHSNQRDLLIQKRDLLVQKLNRLMAERNKLQEEFDKKYSYNVPTF